MSEIERIVDTTQITVGDVVTGWRRRLDETTDALVRCEAVILAQQRQITELLDQLREYRRAESETGVPSS